MRRAQRIDLSKEMASVATEMRRRALFGVTDGRSTVSNMIYLRSCRTVHDLTRTTIMFTRDVGYHTSGWWKNPDYERCWHLSLSAAPATIIVPGCPQVADLDHKLERAWIEAFYGPDAHLLWAEPPYSIQEKKAGVWHWRLFCDEAWSPILPRGEVYGTEFTEYGWMSWSDVQARRANAIAARAPTR